MKRTIYSATLLLAMLTTACGGGNKEVTGLPLIDVNASYPEKEICLQDVAEVSYVPLQTTDEFLLADAASMEMVSSESICLKKTARQTALRIGRIIIPPWE